MSTHILIAGGAGFIGSNLATFLKGEDQDRRILCIDNLRRRGSELALGHLAENGIRFVHGDVRNTDDLDAIPDSIDVIIDCSADPAVLAGIQGSPYYAIQCNLLGAINLLEVARRCRSRFVLLSSSRVYPYTVLAQLGIRHGAIRAELTDTRGVGGVSALGVSEEFPLGGLRSLYGATKLCAELIANEYSANYGVEVIINRCGLIAGPWQVGTERQGVVSHWVTCHAFGKPLKYIGFSGKGTQVRDVLHVADLCRLIGLQIEGEMLALFECFNVGGGPRRAISLRELTRLCQEVTGQHVSVESENGGRPADIPWFVTDSRRAEERFGWLPRRTVKEVIRDIYGWVCSHREDLELVLLPEE